MFGDKLVQLIEEHRVSQAEIARVVGTDAGTVTRWKQKRKNKGGGYARPTTEQFLALARFFERPMEELVDDKLKLGQLRPDMGGPVTDAAQFINALSPEDQQRAWQLLQIAAVVKFPVALQRVVALPDIAAKTPYEPEPPQKNAAPRRGR